MIYEGLRVAKEMGVNRSWAIQRRQKYLTEELVKVRGEIKGSEWWIDDRLGEVSDLEMFMGIDHHLKLAREHHKILDEMDTIKRMVKDPKGEITPDMIERARHFPIERLVEFTRGKATAWCHNDRNPSLVHLTRINKAWCPVCDKFFDSIGVLMDRGMDFKSAVKELAG